MPVATAPLVIPPVIKPTSAGNVRGIVPIDVEIGGAALLALSR